MSFIKKIPKSVWALLAAAIVLILIKNEDYYTTLFNFVIIYVIAVSGLDILFGYSGQISMGHAMFFASGAYTSAILTTNFGINPWLGILAGVLVSSVLALIVAIPASNLVHMFLSLLTIAFGQMVYVFISKCIPVTRGMQGIRAIPDISIFGLELHSNISFAIFGLIVAALALFVKQRIVKSSTGRAMLAIKENVTAANGMGINVRKYKIMAFVVSAIFTSVAGSLYAHFVGYISPETFNNAQSTMFMTMLLFGGMGNLVGPVFGAGVLAVLNELLQNFSTFKTLIYGFLILISVLFMPTGCYGLGKNLIGKLKDRITEKMSKKSRKQVK